jgi:hypothetical protein
MLLCVVISILGLYGYFHVIELTGSPMSADLFPIGRIRSVMTLSILLCIVYAYDLKWYAISQIRYTQLGGVNPLGHVVNQLNGHDFDDDSGKAAPADSILLQLGVFLLGSVLLDSVLSMNHTIRIWFLGLLAAVVLAFALFNMLSVAICQSNILKQQQQQQQQQQPRRFASVVRDGYGAEGDWLNSSSYKND